MKILQVSDYREGGGCEVLVARTIELLHARGHDVELLSSEDVPGHRRTPLSYIDSRRCRRALAERIRAVRPDIVHLHNFYHELSPGILETLKRDAPGRVVMTAHDYHLICPNSGFFHLAGETVCPVDPTERPHLGTLLRRRWDHRGRTHSLLKVAQHLWNYRWRRRHEAIDLIICPGSFLERTLAQHGLPTTHIPNPMPPPPASQIARVEALQLIFAGRVEPEKGLEPLLEAIPASFPGSLVIVGDGGRIAACRAICKRRGLDQVSFAGRLSHERTLEEIARSHVLILPSLCYENDPLTLLEAMALGTSILTSDRGAMKDTVERTGIGLLFDPDDPASLHSALDTIVRQHAEGSLNRFDAGSALKGRDETAYVDALIAVYDRVCA